MKTMKKLMMLAILAFAPTAMFAADHIVFIHGWQMFSWGKPDTWDDMVDCMTNKTYGVPYTTQDKILVADYKEMSGNATIKRIAVKVWGQINKRFNDGEKLPKMDFVVHSMGGLVLRSMVHQGLLDESLIDHVVTLASPHYGQSWNKSRQQKCMEFGSQFIWELANTSNKIAANKVLCVVATSDDVVDEWSAALNDCFAVRYVDKTHTTGGEGICKCSGGRADPVYRMVTEFLSSGSVSTGSLTGKKNYGAILFQVVDGRNNPVAYECKYKSSSSFVNQINDETGAKTYYRAYSPAESFGTGVGSVAVLPDVYKGLKPGPYTLDFQESKDKTFTAFTSEPIPVVRGRTTVIPIHAENVRPLDYVFLIDTTGSMGSHINSVKANAKNLIESQLLNGARNSRVAVVDYRDFPERTGSSSDYAYDVKCKFTSDAATAIAAINSLTLGYGGDGPETVYSGIHACIVGKGAKIGGWQENSVKTIMVMGDAKPLDPEPITGYTKSDVVRWANELKTDEDDEAIDIEYRLKAANMKAAKAVSVKAADVVAGASAGGISIYPVVTSSSLVSSFSEIAEETGGKVVSSTSYASVADAVKEVVEQSVAANGFEFEAVSVAETAGSVKVRVFGGSESDSASIGYQVVSGSAVAGKDYTASADEQRLSWTEGERSYKEIVIPISEDSVSSLDKFFSIVLCNPVNMGLGGINVCRVNLTNVHSSESTPAGDVYIQGVTRQSEMGAVSGSGFYSLGEKAVLTATANDGFVFTSWENGSTSAKRNIDVSDACSNAVDGVMTYVASFMSLADLPKPVIAGEDTLRMSFGDEICWALDYSSVSAVEILCTGLPKGLKFSDGMVYGRAVKLGAYEVKFTVKNAKGSVSKKMRFIIQDSANFSNKELSVAEGKHVKVGIRGGALDAASSVSVYLMYNTATAADVNMSKGVIGSKTPKGGLKFPVKLKWAKGELVEKFIKIPVKSDTLVEGEEFFTLQLAAANGMDLGDDRVCTVRITDSQKNVPPSDATKVLDGNGAVVGYITKPDGSGNVTAKAMPGYVFKRWIYANGKTHSSDATIADGLRKSKKLKPRFTALHYLRGLADPANGGKVAGSGRYVDGKVVTLKATPNKSWTFGGWINSDGAAMPETKSVKVSVTNEATYIAVFNPYPKVTVAVKGAKGGTVKGAGSYRKGKTFKLKATPKKGYAFVGWYDANGKLISQSATYKQKMTASDMALTARFKKESALAKPVLTWDGETSLTVGVNYLAKLKVSGESMMSITKVAGLPKGLTYGSGKVTGVPTLKKVYTAVVTVALKSNKKKTWKYKVKLNVAALPTWALGTFNGTLYDGGGDDAVSKGSVTLTIGKSGKVSGKFVSLDKKKYSFAASSFMAYGEDGVLRTEVKMKYNKKVVVLGVAVGVLQTDEGEKVGVAEIGSSDAPFFGAVAQLFK